MALTNRQKDILNQHNPLFLEGGITTSIDEAHTNAGLGAAHASADGNSHSNVVLNNAHRTGSGSDHADVASNTSAIAAAVSSTVGGAGNAGKLVELDGSGQLDGYDSTDWADIATALADAATADAKAVAAQGDATQGLSEVDLLAPVDRPRTIGTMATVRDTSDLESAGWTYNPATLTYTAPNDDINTFDGVPAFGGMVILLTNEASPTSNGLYTVTTAGGGLGSGVIGLLTRHADLDSDADLVAGVLFPVAAGTHQDIMYEITRSWARGAVPVLDTDTIIFRESAYTISTSFGLATAGKCVVTGNSGGIEGYSVGNIGNQLEQLYDQSRPSPAQRIHRSSYIIDDPLTNGAVGTHTMGWESLPSGAIATRAFYRMSVAFSSAGLATVSLGIDVDSPDAVASAAAFDDAKYAPTLHNGDMDGLVGNMVTLTDSRLPVIVIGAEPLTAGTVHMYIEYVMA